MKPDFDEAKHYINYTTKKEPRARVLKYWNGEEDRMRARGRGKTPMIEIIKDPL